MQQQQDGLGFRFNARDFDPQQGPGQLPVGTHKVQILTGHCKPTQKGDGGYLQLILQIIEGENAGSTGTVNLNIHNPSEKAKRIAMEELSRICHVVGVYDVDFVHQMANIPFMVKVEKRQDDDRFTEVTKYFDINGEPPRRSGPSKAPAPTQQPQVTQAPFGGQIVSQPAPMVAPYQPAPTPGYAQPGAPSPFGQPQPQPQQEPTQTSWQQAQPQQATNWDNAGSAGKPTPWKLPGQ